MTITDDAASLNEWYAVAGMDDLRVNGPRRTRLLGQDIVIEPAANGAPCVATAGEGAGRELPSQVLYGYVWASLGEPARSPLDMPEFAEDRRRFVDCGTVTVRTSPYRVVENFLDMAHFPYVHTGILGEEPLTVVEDYTVEIRQPEDEIWATDCTFYQPKAAMSAEGGIQTRYEYRVGAPCVTVLYKTCPVVEDAWDLIGIFVQPREEDLCDVHVWMLLIDDATPLASLLSFQHMIFVQDRSILENQVPAGIPLDVGAEMAIPGDKMSMTYRRWLRQKGIVFGTSRATA